jgi:AcrR family transcriptional regulator
MIEEIAAQRPTRRQRRSAETQTRLLDAATAAFLERGYDALAMAEVTERADLGTGTLYLHFDDKRALYEAVVRRALAGLFQQWQSTISEDDTRSARVLAMVRVALEFLTAHPDQARLFLLDGPAVESWLVDDVARVIATFLDGSQRELRASLLIGSTLAAARHHVRNDRQPGARQLLETTLSFCAGGIEGSVQRPAAGGRRRAVRKPR